MPVVHDPASELIPFLLLSWYILSVPLQFGDARGQGTANFSPWCPRKIQTKMGIATALEEGRRRASTGLCWEPACPCRSRRFCPTTLALHKWNSGRSSRRQRVPPVKAKQSPAVYTSRREKHDREPHRGAVGVKQQQHQNLPLSLLECPSRNQPEFDINVRAVVLSVPFFLFLCLFNKGRVTSRSKWEGKGEGRERPDHAACAFSPMTFPSCARR